MPIRRDENEGRATNAGRWLAPLVLLVMVTVGFFAIPLLFVEPVLARQALKSGETMTVVSATWGTRHEVERGSPADRYLPKWLTHKERLPSVARDTEKPALMIWVDQPSDSLETAFRSWRFLPELFDDHGCSFGEGWADSSGAASTVAYRFTHVPRAGQRLAMGIEGNPAVSFPSPVPARLDSAPFPTLPATGRSGSLEVSVKSLTQRAWVDRNQTVGRLDVREAGMETLAWRPIWIRAENEYGDVRETGLPTLFTDETFGFDSFCKDDAYLKLRIRLGVLRPDLRKADAEWRLPWRDVIEYQTGIRETQVLRAKDLLLRFTQSANAPGTGPQILWIGHGPKSPQLTVSLRSVNAKPSAQNRVWITSSTGSDSTCILPERLEMRRRDLILSVWRTREVELVVDKRNGSSRKSP